jgi:hypothetical protein
VGLIQVSKEKEFTLEQQTLESRIPRSWSDATLFYSENFRYGQVSLVELSPIASSRAATDSAGKGMHNGGEGVIRDIEFLEPIQCSILSERRVHQPKGLMEGGNAASGRNLWVKQRRKADGDLQEDQENVEPRIINLGGKQTVSMGTHDRIVIMTPGGGGYGKAGEERKVKERLHGHHHGSARGSHADRSALAEGSS